MVECCYSHIWSYMILWISVLVPSHPKLRCRIFVPVVEIPSSRFKFLLGAGNQLFWSSCRPLSACQITDLTSVPLGRSFLKDFSEIRSVGIVGCSILRYSGLVHRLWHSILGDLSGVYDGWWFKKIYSDWFSQSGNLLISCSFQGTLADQRMTTTFL